MRRNFDGKGRAYRSLAETARTPDAGGEALA
jgi:hypothetical protein